MTQHVRSPRARLGGLVVIAGLGFLALEAGAGEASRAERSAGGGAVRFVQRPGVLEFTGRMIVRPVPVAEWVRGGLSPADARARHDAASARVRPGLVEFVAATDESIVRLPAGRGWDESSYADVLLATGDYQYAHPDWRCYPVGTPDDPYFPYQWHHVNINSSAAWDITQGDPSIVTAFVDTGIDLTHPDLAPHRIPGYNSADRIAEVDGGDVHDINGHGTWVSGTASAIGNNAQGVAGVGWNFPIMMVRTTDSGDGSAAISDIMAGARWAAENGARVVSASYSGVSSGTVGATGTYIKSLGSLFCYAAGNDGAYLGGFDYPDVVVCGATNSSDQRTGWSAYGPGVDVFAPGEGIWSTSAGGGYDAVSGTSFSTPMTNGALAMVWSIDPGFTPDMVMNILFHACDDMGDPGDDPLYGWGRINVGRAVADAVTALTPLPPVAGADAAETPQETDVGIDVLANDTDPNYDAISLVAVDAASAAGGSLMISLGTGLDGRDVVVYRPPPGFSGEDSFAYTIADTGGLGATGAVTVTVVPLDQFRDPDHPDTVYTGLDADYYAVSGASALPDFSGLTPYAHGTAPKLAYASTDGAFAGSGRSDEVGAVFTGYLSVPETAYYTLSTESDDGSALYIGGVKVVDNDFLHGMEERSGRIGLKAGLHALRVEFFENFGGAGLIARMEGGDSGKRTIPAEFFFRPGCGPDINGDGVLNINDFIAFQSLFTQRDARADWNKDGKFNINDYIAYQYAFNVGCP